MGKLFLAKYNKFFQYGFFFFFNSLDLWQKSSTQKKEKNFGKILNFLDFGLGISIPKYKKKLFLKKYKEFTQGCYAIYLIFLTWNSKVYQVALIFSIFTTIYLHINQIYFLRDISSTLFFLNWQM